MLSLSLKEQIYVCMKFFLAFFCVVLFMCCRKNPKMSKTGAGDLSFYVEDFRKAGMDDYQTIMAACDSLPANSKVIFAAKTYTISHTPIIEKSLQFFGPATFKRENQITYTVKEPADASSRFLVLNSTMGLIKDERIEICINDNITGATIINVISDIKGDTILLDAPIGNTFGGSSSFPGGTKVFKNINFFWVLAQIRYTDMSCSFNSMTFDGNRQNNSGTYFWNINASIMSISNGTTFYDNCTFINSPNETIVGHDADIRNCVFLNLNGSAFHTVADKRYCAEVDIHSIVKNNTFQNTNRVSTITTGHSEGVITHSQCGGYYTATGNTFINVGESVLGALAPGISQYDWGTSNITFTGNTINGAGRMVYAVDTSYSGSIHNVKIEKNAIKNLTGKDWSREMKFWPDLVIKNKDAE